MRARPPAVNYRNRKDVSKVCNQTDESDRREKMLALREKLLQVEKARAAGDKGVTVDELDEQLGKTIEGVRGRR